MLLHSLTFPTWSVPRTRQYFSDGDTVRLKLVEIVVLELSERNFPPVFPRLGTIEAAEGEWIEVPLEVLDVDGDNLLFASSNLPEGAELDVYSGVLRWKPGSRQAGSYPGIIVEVFDGRFLVKGTIDLSVRDGRDAGDADVSLLLRSDDAYRRLGGLKQWGSHPFSHRLLEAVRLLRDRDREVRGEALKLLQALAVSSAPSYVSMILKDVTPHAWHFTDAPEVLKWLETFLDRGEEAGPLKQSLSLINRYNKLREGNRSVKSVKGSATFDLVSALRSGWRPSLRA
ncbi:MAG: hypothetical protein HY716_06125 [Planctomycetes bacterium]|nr:hypothetical protein [Planctomycetota bacterium]